jgi:hypothetical protein
MKQDSFIEFTLDDSADSETRKQVAKTLQAAGATAPVTPQTGNTIRVPLQLSLEDQQLLQAVSQLQYVDNVAIHTTAGTFTMQGSSWSSGAMESQPGYSDQSNASPTSSSWSRSDDTQPFRSGASSEQEMPQHDISHSGDKSGYGGKDRPIH